MRLLRIESLGTPAIRELMIVIEHTLFHHKVTPDSALHVYRMGLAKYSARTASSVF